MAVPSNCICLDRAGDNGDCPVHPTQVWGRAVPRFDNPLENWTREKAERIPVLEEREKTHGCYAEVAIKAQHIKDEFRQAMRYTLLDEYHRESLDLIATKLSRILNGNPNEIDHWKDIAGYATLVVEILEKKGKS